jgi:hypothetical protein
MIPTRYKAKLPSDLSYPLGAKETSEALAGVPQYDLLHLWFSDRPVFRASAFRSVLDAGSPYTIFEVRFTKMEPGHGASRAMIAAGHYDKQWQLHVYPVRRQQRRAAHEALLRDAMPAAREWLSRPGTAGWESGMKQLAFVFDPRSLMITSSDSGEVLYGNPTPT